MSKRGRKPKNYKPAAEPTAPAVEPIAEPISEPVETAPEIIEEESPRIVALKEFIELWRGLPHYNSVTDKQAREIHAIWQRVTGRTDYYTHCSSCLIAHVKQLKKICKNEGFTI